MGRIDFYRCGAVGDFGWFLDGRMSIQQMILLVLGATFLAVLLVIAVTFVAVVVGEYLDHAPRQFVREREQYWIA